MLDLSKYRQKKLAACGFIRRAMPLISLSFLPNPITDRNLQNTLCALGWTYESRSARILSPHQLIGFARAMQWRTARHAGLIK
jgi:hypothetical protein